MDPSKIHDSARFKGCLIGAYIGDCAGGLFKQGNRDIQPIAFPTVVETLSSKSCWMPSDVSYLSGAVAHSLIDCQKFIDTHVAQNLADCYFEFPERRKFFTTVKDVFFAWKLNGIQPKTVYFPAAQQFRGTGSYGNGAAVRVAPLVLHNYYDLDSALKDVDQSSRLTHGNLLAVRGAKLQACAIFEAVHLQHPDAAGFITALISFCDSMEVNNQFKFYSNRLKKVQKFLADYTEPQDVVKALGNGIKALETVPLAIYCAVRAMPPVAGIHTDNPFERAIILAISMGGDTNTIASMAGAITGAGLGNERIPVVMKMPCYDIEEPEVLGSELAKVLQDRIEKSVAFNNSCPYRSHEKLVRATLS
ncbi:ADP-ribosylhydrolase ARH3-like [Paramacrobiotus metropolitanus]|uniref:ADP-ribosylhydrolase ARH3-like n=1 Tax=Paramacrobiotus metropolitanus TaxID=2943436 RepID=UPI002445F024|nr:ADP-ribosylhydrolase ARH3-like [Paramacrobiotus metropolitanus]